MTGDIDHNRSEGSKRSHSDFSARIKYNLKLGKVGHRQLFPLGNSIDYSIKFLADASCTTNLLFKIVFDRLPLSVRAMLENKTFTT